jgi:hypothetical protein
MANDWTAWSVLLRNLYFLPFLLYAALIIHILRAYYPAVDISRSYRILFRILSALVILLLLGVVFVLIGFTLSIDETNTLADALRDPTTLSILIVLIFFLITQIYLLFEGNWLLKTIRKNFRTSLLDSMQL